MEDRIAQALTKLFDRHRIVFWYDQKKELFSSFDTLDLPGIEKLKLENNEFTVKHRILREEPSTKFLLFRDGSKPADLDNWLLDVELAHGQFRTDQAGLWLSELDLGLEFLDVVQEHTEFYYADKRKESLKHLLKPDDTPGMIRMKMLSICAGSDPRMDSVLECLLGELAEGREEKLKLIFRCNLAEFLWEQMARCYGYRSQEPGIRDFAIDLFKSCYAMGTDTKATLSADALVFLKRWKDSRRFETAFEKVSVECADTLGIEQDLAKRDFRDLLDLDYYRLIDQKIISDLVRAVTAKTVSSGEVSLWVRQRKQSHWYPEFKHLYEAVEYAAMFMQAMNQSQLDMDSMTDGIHRYTRSWFRLDQLYRKFIHHVRSSGQASLMGPLAEQIENLYTNSVLLKMNDRWQSFVDSAENWTATSLPLQKQFFEANVRPFLAKDNKVCVIICDALRFEIADELLSLIRQEDRYEGTLEPVLSMLPSYTQLCMAALLPNRELCFAEGDPGTVQVDGQSSQGTVNRGKILDLAVPGRTTVLKAGELMSMKKEDCRAVMREHDVIYIYQNRIDAVGDKRESEEHVFEAVEETLQEIIRLVKKLTGANANNILVTADHGFIYQHRAIEESDFSSADTAGDRILLRDRRFILGTGLKESSGLRKFLASELGLTGKVEVQIPKSINRLRLKGSGSRFVHGGASLQEVVLPLLRINKKRQSDISVVEVDILRGSSSVITSGQLAIGLYQTQPVTDKVQSRKLRAGIYTESGELISDSHEVTFDLISENPRERELKIRFLLSRKADDANGQEVLLKLEEKVPSTSHFKEYKSIRYLMRRSFTSDFDF